MNYAVQTYLLYVFNRMRRRALLLNAAPPVEPEGRVVPVH